MTDLNIDETRLSMWVVVHFRVIRSARLIFLLQIAWFAVFDNDQRIKLGAVTSLTINAD